MPADDCAELITRMRYGDAVFGDEIVQFNGGSAHITRAKNGFWHGPNGPRNTHVSAVLLSPETGLSKLREEKWQPVLAVHPWADHPLPDELEGRMKAIPLQASAGASQFGPLFSSIRSRSL